MGLMQWGIKAIYLDPQSLPFVSSWFVLMWEPNPAKADYTCIKFLKIAVFLIPHLQWKCNRSSLQNINLPNCVSAAIKRSRLVSGKRSTLVNSPPKNWTAVPMMMFLCKKVGRKHWKTWGRKTVTANTADMGYKRVRVIDCALWPK